MLVPLEPLDLLEGSEVETTLATSPDEVDIEASRAAAGGWKGNVDAEELIRNVYTGRLVQTRPVPRCE